MPTTAAGATIMQKMIKLYGKKKGQSVFYGKVNSSKKFARTTGEMSVWNRGHKS